MEQQVTAKRYTHAELSGDHGCSDCSNFNSRIDVEYKGKVYHFCCGCCEMNFPKLDGVEIVDVMEPVYPKLTAKEKLSPAMLGVLTALGRRAQPIRDARNGNPIPGLAWGTFEALKRRGYCDWNELAVEITESGLDRLERV